MVLFDAGVLIKLLDPKTPAIQKAKLDYLLTTLQKSRTKILIPTPALAEFYVKASPDALAELKGKAFIIIAPFDEKAAIECAISIAGALGSNQKKGPQAEASWQKIKFDHQIVAIAKSNGVKVIYSEDAGLRKFATALGLNAFCTDDLPDGMESNI